jgi:hypothetical protein
VPFTAGTAVPLDIVGNVVSQSDGRCAPTQTLQVYVDGAWIEYGTETEQSIGFITGFVSDMTAPTFTFSMTKDAYAAMFAESDADVNYIEVRIVTTDALSEADL